MAINLIFRKIAYKKNFGFFGENRASSLFYTWNRLTCCKKSEKSNDRKYDNFCHGGRTEAILKDQSVGPKRTKLSADSGRIWKRPQKIIMICGHIYEADEVEDL